MSYQFGPLERPIDFRFPTIQTVYWLWATGGRGSFAQPFPGPDTWVDTFTRQVGFHLETAERITPAPWLHPANTFGQTRNEIKPHSVSTFCGIDITGTYTPPTAVRFNIKLQGKVLNEMASITTGGFFLDPKEAVLFAHNVFNKSLHFDDFAGNHSWPYQFFFVAVPAPSIFKVDLPGGAILAEPRVICDLSPYAYLSPPHPSFTEIQIWKTHWPVGGSGPINALIPKVHLHVAKIAAVNPTGPNPDTSGDPGTFKYAVFDGGKLEPGGSGFQSYKNIVDPTLGFTGTQITDAIDSFDEAVTAAKNLEAIANAKRKLFFPRDHFPDLSKFKYDAKLYATINYEGGGKTDPTIKPPIQQHVCTFPPQIVTSVGDTTGVIDSCGHVVPPINIILGQETPGFEGPIGVDYTGLTVP